MPQQPNAPTPGRDPLGEFAPIHQAQPQPENRGGDCASASTLPVTLEQALADGWEIAHDKCRALADCLGSNVYPQWFDSFKVRPAQPLDVSCELVLVRWNDAADAWESLRVPVQLTARVAGPPRDYQREPSRADRELAAVCRAVEAAIRRASPPPDTGTASGDSAL